jgi:hypothetical protein
MIERPRAVTDLWSILEREGYVPFRRVDCISEKFSPRERRRDGGGERASCAMRAADSHSWRAKFAEIVAVVENVYCILSLDVAGDGSRAPAFYSAARAPRATSACAASRIASRFDTSRPVRILASRKFGVTTVAKREHHLTHHRDRIGFEEGVAARCDHHGIDHDIRDLVKVDSIRDGAYYVASGEHPGFRGCDREVICDRINLRSDKGGIEVGNAAHAACILRGYRGDGAGAEDGERREGLEVRLDCRASAGIRTCDGERDSGHCAWSLPR